MMLQFNKIRAGYYVTPDGRYGVMIDGYGYVPVDETNGSGVMAGIVGNEWCAIYSKDGGLRESEHAGEVIDWFDFKREAVAECERLARQGDS